MKPTDPNYAAWRKNTGRPKAIKSPDILWEHFNGYRKEVDSRPFIKQDFVRGGDNAGQKVDVEAQLPYTWSGFEVYLFEQGVAANLDKYKMNFENAYSEFIDIIRVIDKIIFTRNFSGAAVNAFNANLIARSLGLQDKQQIEVIKEQPLFGDDPI